MRQTLRRLAILIVFVGLAGSAHAAEDPVLVVRIESLDAVTADLARFPGAGPGAGLETLLANPLLSVGKEIDWVDGSRPAVMVLPMEGLMAGANGMLVALPYKNAEAASEALSALENNGRAVQSRPDEGYVVMGPNADSLRKLDLASAIRTGDLPAGNLTADFNLEKVAPMIRMGLASGRQMVEQQMTNQAEAQGSGITPEAMKSMTGFYFDLIDDVLSNSSRLQLSLEAQTEDFVVHLRMVPIPGSTLEGLQRAQKGGLPDLARFIERGGDSMTMAGQITYTPEFLDAFKVYMKRYGAMMTELTSAYQAQAGDAGMGNWFSSIFSSMDKWVDCYRGDFAGSYRIGGETGIETVAIIGTDDAGACRELMSQMADMTLRVPTGADASMHVETKEDTLTYRGVEATRTEIRVELPDGEHSAEQELMQSMFGPGLISYSGLTHKKMLVTATGGDAESNFKQMVDRVAKPHSSKKMSPETFAPLTVGPGVFATINFKSLFGWIEALGTQADSPALQRIRDLPDRAGRLVYGARFDGSGLNLEVGVPFGLLQAFAGEEP